MRLAIKFINSYKGIDSTTLSQLKTMIDMEGVMKSFANGFLGAVGVISWIATIVTHIISAVYLYNHVKLWAFLIVLLVPGLGDIMGIYYVITLRFWLPLIAYAVTTSLFILAGLVANKTNDIEAY